MARMSRLAVAGQPHLVIQRPRTKRVFIEDADRVDYLGALRELTHGGSVAIHAFALVEEGVLMLVTPRTAPELGRFMQRLNRRFVPAHHRRHGGIGPLWTGRFQAAAIDPEHYLLRCILMIEQAPVRAGAVESAKDWPWSSAAHHLGRCPLEWLAVHPAWWRLGNTPFEREANHSIALQRMLRNEQVHELLTAVQGGWPLGSRAFIAGVAAESTRPVAPNPRGRPRRKPESNLTVPIKISA